MVEYHPLDCEGYLPGFYDWIIIHKEIEDIYFFNVACEYWWFRKFGNFMLYNCYPIYCIMYRLSLRLQGWKL